LTVLPLVSKRWARILRQPSEAWQHAEIDLASLLSRKSLADVSDDAMARVVLSQCAVMSWFGRRPNCVLQMELGASSEIYTLPAVTTATILGSQCSSLRVLHMEVSHVGLSGVETAALAALTKLERLQVAVGDELFEDRADALLWTVAHLPALLELVVSYQGTKVRSGPDADGLIYGLPRCHELAQLRSSSLTHLKVSLVGGCAKMNTLRLIGLPQLRGCVIVAEGRGPANIRIDADSFRGAPQLRELRIHGEAGLQLHPDSFKRLNALTSLSLVACGLSRMPAAAAAL
jgi:hypothetical protein